MRGRLVGDLALVFLAASYLGFVLFDDVESPLLSILLFVAVAYELIHAHRRRDEYPAPSATSAADLDSGAADCDEAC